MSKCFYRFSYLSPKEESRSLLPHQVRDGAAFAEMSANLYSKGYTYGGLLLNYPARDRKVTTYIDTSFLDPSDLIVLTTRPPLDDFLYGDHKQIRRSHTSLEDEVFSILRPHLEVSARSRIKLSRPRAIELQKAAEVRGDNSGNKADIKFFSHAGSKHIGASYKEFKQYDDSLPYEVPGLADQNKTAVYLLHAKAAFKNGAGLIVAFGMGGTETLVWNYLLRVREDLTNLLASTVFVMGELTVGPLPERPTDLSFAKNWPVNLLLVSHSSEWRAV